MEELAERRRGGRVEQGMAVAQAEEQLVVVGRRGGPGFLDSEIARLAHLVAMAASLRRNA